MYRSIVLQNRLSMTENKVKSEVYIPLSHKCNQLRTMRVLNVFTMLCVALIMPDTSNLSTKLVSHKIAHLENLSKHHTKTHNFVISIKTDINWQNIT